MDLLLSGFVDCTSISPPHSDGSLESWTSLKMSSLHPFPRKEMHIVTFKTKILLTVCRGEERGGDGGRRNPRELK